MILDIFRTKLRETKREIFDIPKLSFLRLKKLLMSLTMRFPKIKVKKKFNYNISSICYQRGDTIKKSSFSLIGKRV